MRKKSIVFVSLIVILLLTACGTKNEVPAGTIQNQNSPATAVNEITSEPENTLAPEKPMVISVDLGETILVPEGGFRFQQIPDYQFSIMGASAVMMAAEADPDLGPIMQLIGGYTKEGTTTQQLYEQLKRETPLRISPSESIEIAGLEGLSADISGENNGRSMSGRAALLMVDNQQQFVLIMGAPTEVWEDFSPYFEAVIRSLIFSQPEIPAIQSNLSPGSYAFTNANVIRDVAVLDQFAYAATLGGMVAWNWEDGTSNKYTPLDGMGHVSATSITACNIPAPRILVGTLRGISSFDPATGKWAADSILPADSKLTTSKITRLFCDQANNRLLIGSTGLGILDLATRELELINKQNGLLWEEVQDITVAGKDIWIANGYKGISRISGSTVTNFSQENGMPDERTAAIALAPDGTVWAGGSTGLMSFKNGKWTLFGRDTDAKLTDINEVEVSADGNLWVATASLGGGRICLFNPVNGTCESEFKEKIIQPILALTLINDDTALFGTSQGLSIFDGATLNSLQTGDQLISNYVDSFSQSPQGELWVGTDSGMHVLDPLNPLGSAWTTYNKAQANGLGGNWASSIAMASNGVVWVALINGEASRFENGSWTSFQDLYSYNIVALDSQDRAWFGDDGKGITVLNQDGSLAFKLTTADGLPGDNVYALVNDPSGMMWIGTENGLARFENGSLETVFGKDDSRLPNRYIRDLAITPDGQLLIGMFTAVAVYDGSQVNVVLDVLKDGFSDVRLTTIAVAPNGRIWVGTDKGLLKSDLDGQWELLNTESGLMTNTISALIVDSSGALWVGGGGSNFDGGGILLMVP